DRVRAEVRPDPRDADELHDALLTAGFLTREGAGAESDTLFAQLIAARRAAMVVSPLRAYVAAERLPEIAAIHPDTVIEGDAAPPPSRASHVWTRDEAIREMLRSRLAIVGPTTHWALAAALAIDAADAEAALLALEAEGVILRGSFSRST